MGDLIRNIDELPARDSIEVTPTGLDISGSVTYEEWLNLIAGLQRIGAAWKWAVGDGLNYGELKWGEKYAQATVFAEEVGLTAHTVANIMRVASNVPRSVRKASLSHEHHATVQYLPVEVQNGLLCLADLGGWTRKDMRLHAAEAKRRLSSGEPLGLTDDPREPFLRRRRIEETKEDRAELAHEPTADPPPEPTTETRTGPVEEAPEEEGDVYGEVDLLAELEEAQARADRAEEIVRELARDDDAQAVIEWRDKYHRLRGRLQDVQRSYHEERKTREWQTDLLRKIRAFLGVQRSSQIMDALKRRGSG